MTPQGEGEQPRQNTSYLNSMGEAGTEVGGFYLENHPNDRSQGAGLADKTGAWGARNDPKIQPLTGPQLHRPLAAKGQDSPEPDPRQRLVPFRPVLHISPPLPDRRRARRGLQFVFDVPHPRLLVPNWGYRAGPGAGAKIQGTRSVW